MRQYWRDNSLLIILAILTTINILFWAYYTFGPPKIVEFKTPNVYYNGVEQACVKNDAQSDSNTSAWDCSPKKAA